jgi:large conductance mechanosensitive channel
MVKEFKAFINRGNVIDLAVAVIIGGAFRNIVSSLVVDVLMPIIGKVLGNTDITALKWILEPAQGEMAEVAIYYGAFLQNIIDFFIIAFVIFMIIKILASFRRKEESKEAVVETIPEDIELLREIRDSLKK